MTVTDEGYLPGRKFASARPIVDEDKIVPGTVHFRKPQHNRSLTYPKLLRKLNVRRTGGNVSACRRVAVGRGSVRAGIPALPFHELHARTAALRPPNAERRTKIHLHLG